MTHPPYGDDERNRSSGSDAPPPGWGRHGQPPSGPPAAGPAPYGPPPAGPSPYGPPQFGPPRSAPPQYGQPQFSPPQYGQPQYGQPQYGQPPHGQPQYGPPQYERPQYERPQYEQPQYGQPGWAPVPQRRRSRLPLLLALLLGVLVLAVGAALFLPQLRTPALDPQAVQRDVAEQFQQREGVAVELRCGEGMTVQPGRSYECSGTTADGEPVTITIAITDEDANYTWAEG